jgi:hypothetical protein
MMDYVYTAEEYTRAIALERKIARDLALEEAAKVAEQAMEESEYHLDGQEIAAAIRKLIAQ